MLNSLMRRIAGRCETHDRASYVVTARLEQEAGMPASPPPADFTDAHLDPNLIDCGHAWCRTRRH
ncbi:hypothetical protein ACFW91_24960 [Streptomyces asoensis]|uniref:hypothetical protein n=1 Tax=Streptomyces asoensis TaxID=249586 RepID=UPI003698D029